MAAASTALSAGADGSHLYTPCGWCPAWLPQVAQYPRVFIHDPVQYIGPRLAYLGAFRPGAQRRVGESWGQLGVAVGGGGQA